MHRIAIYAGSFDPCTNGHLWMIEQGAALFDKLIVGVGNNPAKKPTFSFKERKEMLRELTKNLANVEVEAFEKEYLVSFAKRNGANYILRGMRNDDDFRQETGMRHINADIDKTIQTVFLIPPRELIEVSSSLVKGMYGFDGWENVMESRVPSVVLNAFKKLKQ